MITSEESDKNNRSDKLLIRALTAENKKLHVRIAKLETKIISLANRAAALDKEIKAGGNRQLAEILGSIMQRGNDSRQP